MQRNSVQSSMISSIGYDSENEQLEIQFKRGDTRVYKTVPSSVFKAFTEASSAGKYFLANIRQKFPYDAAPTLPVKG